MDLEALRNNINERFSSQEDEVLKTDLLTVIDKLIALEVENVILGRQLRELLRK
jgi:hypothetical protein